MDLKKTKILLAKVNTLFQSMNSDEGHIAPIEKDLMRSYLRELYEQFYDLENNGEVVDPPSKVPEKVEEDIEVIRVKKDPPPPPPPPAPPKPAPRIVEVPKSVKVDPAPPAPAPEPVEPPAPKEEPQAPPAPKVRPVSSSAEMEELFETPEQPAKELSEKLSEMPVPDLSKAMGLNERIFTINELFGGEQDTFDKAMKKLNQYSNFSEAESYLRQLAADYEWTSKNKLKKAKNFLKLVRRRYVKS